MNVIPSYEFRRRALAMIKAVMQVLVVAGMLSVLPQLITSVVIERTGANPNNYIGPVTTKISAFWNSITDEIPAATILRELDALTEELNAAYEAFLQEKGVLFFGMLAFQLLLTPALTVPLHGGLLDALHKREVTMGGVLSRLRLSLKAILLFLWTMIRVYVWMLPGIALMIACLFVPVDMMLPLMFAGMIASVILSLRAMLHYMLAPIALADDPALSLNGCIAASFRVMRRRKLELLGLEISFLGWWLLATMISLMCLSMFGSVLGMALGMMAELLLNIYVCGAQVCFYKAYSAKPGQEEPFPAAEEDLTLN